MSICFIYNYFLEKPDKNVCQTFIHLLSDLFCLRRPVRYAPPLMEHVPLHSKSLRGVIAER